ncbi:MAG: hypothetical protein ABEI86_01070 [Halobacteriaceae archaeon]
MVQTPPPQPLLLAIGYAATLIRFFERDAEGDIEHFALLELRVILSTPIFILMFLHYVFLHWELFLAYYTGIIFSTIPGVVGVILVVIVILDIILEKEGFTGSTE